MVHPISERTDVKEASTFSNFTQKRLDGSLLTRSTFSSYSGYCQSIFNCFSSAWQWIKTYIFCCFFKASQESSETTDACPIPVVTEGGWFNKEINRQIRDLYSLEIPNQPDWDAFPKDAALFFHEISGEIDTRNADSPDLDLDNRINAHFTFPGIDKIMDIIEPNKIIPKEPLQFFYSFYVIYLSLKIKNSIVNIPIAETQEIPEPDGTCPIPLLTDSQWLDTEINNNIRSLFQVKIKNHPEWALYPQPLAAFFSLIYYELGSREFTTNDPLNEVKIDERMAEIIFHEEIENALKINNLGIPPNEIDNLLFVNIFRKTFLSLILKAKMIHQEQQQT